ncbi:predicted protein [Sclerotinia sclerotiorum 1980 UF-70]|uniref:Uncharacterized protein n=1 Tax=Sclerotinia sclerotiorum (strain ATCC 18683 / 1980 / Ss-1) TaxID=665079 RepID=A7EK06_SCLS1|nr:predicted protein [Sclerotinia sclerotiorum 1980 UF-70]EDO03172.1 predicted protein [Sclerotinia sclerotiorum 1980 UF-70]
MALKVRIKVPWFQPVVSAGCRKSRLKVSVLESIAIIHIYEYGSVLFDENGYLNCPEF